MDGNIKEISDRKIRLGDMIEIIRAVKDPENGLEKTVWLFAKLQEPALSAPGIIGTEKYLCDCGAWFELDLGKYGCPNCNGETGAATVFIQMAGADRQLTCAAPSTQEVATTRIDKAETWREPKSKPVANPLPSIEPRPPIKLRPAVDLKQSAPAPIPETPASKIVGAMGSDREVGRRNGPLSAQEKNDIANMHKEGASNGEIAKTLNRWIGPINGYVKKLDDKAKRHEIHLAGETRPTPATVARAKKSTPPAMASKPAVTKKITLPISAIKPKQADAPVLNSSSPLWMREIDSYLNAVGYVNGWSKFDDLLLVDALLKGETWPVLMDQLGRERKEIGDRFKLLVDNSQDRDHQLRVLAVLRLRANA